MMKLKALAASAAIVAVGSANAAIQSPDSDFNNTGGSEMVLAVVGDFGAGVVTRTVDLGISFNAMISSGSFVLNSVISGVNAGMTYQLFASDNVTQGDDSLGVGSDISTWGKRVLVTGNNGSVQTANSVELAASNVRDFVVDTNINPGVNPSAASNDTSNDSTNVGHIPTLINNDLGNALIGGWDADANVGEGLLLNLLGISGDLVNKRGIKLDNKLGSFETLGTFNLDSSGNLAYNVAVVPVPAAFWLFGSALAGLLGLRRRQA